MHKLFRISMFFISVLTTCNLLAGNPVSSDSTNVIKQDDLEVHLPGIIVAGVNYTISLELKSQIAKEYYEENILSVQVNGEWKHLRFKGGKAGFPCRFGKKTSFSLSVGQFEYHKNIHPIPLWLSILPPFIAILMAFFFKEVLTSLFMGIFSGTFIIYFYQETSFLSAFFKGIFAISDTYIIHSLIDSGHISIIIFSMLIGAMVHLITRNGGMMGIVNKLSHYANSPRSVQFIAWIMGVLIFFDDYANSLVVGNTMRPITDRLKVSREKLAYIVDSTAAPVSSVAMITTWIGIELSYIQSATAQIEIDESAYSIFLHSLPTRFYPFLTLLFILLLVWKKRDFGPMYSVEVRSGNQETESPDAADQNNSSNEHSDLTVPENITLRWYNAAIPIIIIIFGTFAGLLYTGWDTDTWNHPELPFSTKLSQIIGASDSYLALLWASLSSVLAAAALTLGQRLLTLKQTIDSLMLGFRTMLTAVLILILAWALADITRDMHTADFISHGLIAAQVSPYLLPSLTFVLSGLIAFSTGSSWGTMAILYPLILPASWTLCHSAGMNDVASINIFYIVVSAILAGSVLGDHCSPISDTTILSSLACSCNHIEHVRTQMPYALTVGAISIIAGLLPAAYGISSWILFPVGIILLYVIVMLFGKKSRE